MPFPFEMIFCRNFFLMPGLAKAHAHLIFFLSSDVIIPCHLASPRLMLEIPPIHDPPTWTSFPFHRRCCSTLPFGRHHCSTVIIAATAAPSSSLLLPSLSLQHCRHCCHCHRFLPLPSHPAALLPHLLLCAQYYIQLLLSSLPHTAIAATIVTSAILPPTPHHRIRCSHRSHRPHCCNRLPQFNTASAIIATAPFHHRCPAIILCRCLHIVAATTPLPLTPMPSFFT